MRLRQRWAFLAAAIAASALAIHPVWSQNRDNTRGIQPLDPVGDAPQADYRNQYAVIIGINYQESHRQQEEMFGTLNKARQDADAVYGTLVADYGYQPEDDQQPFAGKTTWTFFDAGATKDKIEGVLTTVLRDTSEVSRDDSVLFYFAGHGYRDRVHEKGYLIPYNVTFLGDRLVPSSCIEIDHIRQWLNECPARHKLIILDCCHSGHVFPFIQVRGAEDERLRSEQFIRSELFNQEAFQAIASARATQFAADVGGSGEHSPFTEILLAALRSGPGVAERRFFSASQLGRFIQGRMEELDVTIQDPQSGPIGGKGGEFYFFPSDRPRPAVANSFGPLTRGGGELPDPGSRGASSAERDGNTAQRPAEGQGGGGLALALVLSAVLLVAGAAGGYFFYLRQLRLNQQTQTVSMRQPRAARQRRSDGLTTYRVQTIPSVTMPEGTTSRMWLSWGKDAPLIHCVFGKQTDLGRSDECGFKFGPTMRQVSKVHARLRFISGTEFVVEDLGSRNGTYVVGEKVSVNHVLEAGVRVQMGQTVFLRFLRHETEAGTVAELLHEGEDGAVEARYFLVCGNVLPLSLVVPDTAGETARAAEKRTVILDGEIFYLSDGQESRHMSARTLIPFGKQHLRVRIPEEDYVEPRGQTVDEDSVAKP